MDEQTETENTEVTALLVMQLGWSAWRFFFRPLVPKYRQNCLSKPLLTDNQIGIAYLFFPPDHPSTML